MPVFTAAATALVATTALTGVAATIATSVVAAGLALGTGHLLGVFDEPELPSFGDVPFSDPGVDQRLAANTSNRPPILFGSWMTRGMVTYHELSDDRQTSYTVITLGHGQVTSIDRVFWGDTELTLDSAGEVTAGRVVTGEDDNRPVGNVNVQLYPGGGRSTYLEGISSDWTSAHTMTGLTYAVVTVRYNRDDDITGLVDLRFIGSSSVTNPADAVLALLQNTTYGLGLGNEFIDTTGFDTARNYFNEQVAFTDRNGAQQMAPRFQVNGALGTSESVRDRIETILEGSNSSLRWSDGRFSIFSNRADTATAFDVNEGNVIGDIQVTETGFHNLINELEVHYGRDEFNNWTRNTITVSTPQANRYPNEPERHLRIELPLVRTSIEAERLAFIILNQSREQLTIKHIVDVTAMPVEAGDVVSYTLPNYGWNGKLFRVLRVAEMETDEGALQYEIEAVEYAAAVYADRMFIERNASPNTNLPKVDQIPAVTDLAIVAQNPAAAVPSFQIRWTIPSNALIQVYDIYTNNAGGEFGSASTVFHSSVRSAQGLPNFVNGVPFTTSIEGLASGEYNIWVVGRNDFANSGPSNTLSVNWNPVIDVETRVEVIRHHDNPITQDPNAPMGPDGVLVGWYDPVEGSPITTNRPSDPNPHWEARASVIPTGGQRRVIDYGITGISGTRTGTPTDVPQEVTFTVSGTPGQQQSIPAEPEITQFDFSGTTAEFDAARQGSREQWEITATGSSDPTRVSGSEEFFIHLDGNSATNEMVQFEYDSESAADNDAWRWFFGGPSITEGNALASTSELTLRAGQGTTEDNVSLLSQANRDQIVTSLGVDPAITQFQTIPDGVTATVTFRNMSRVSTPITVTPTSVLSGQGPFNGQLRFQPGVAQATSDAFAQSGDNIRVEISISRTLDMASTVQIDIPTESISETITLTDQLMGSTALRDDLVSMLQSRAAITGEFTVTAGTASGLDGITDGEPITVLTANDTTDHTLAVSFSSGDGDISGSSFGTIFDGSSTDQIQSQIRITYDNTLNPSFQDIMLGRSPTSADLASVIQSVVNGHGDLTAAISPNDASTVVITAGTPNPLMEPTVTITTRGTSDALSFAVSTQTQGVARDPSSGTPTMFNVVYGTTTVIETMDLPSNTAFGDIAETIRDMVNALPSHTATAVTNGSFTTTSVADSPDDLVINLINGTNQTSPAATSANNIAVNRITIQPGRAPGETTGSDGVINLLSGGTSFTSINVAGMTSEQVATSIANGFTSTLGTWTGSATGNVVTLTADFNGPNPIIAVGVSAGTTPTGLPATLQVERMIVNNGQMITFSGALTSYTITVAGEDPITGEFESASSAESVASQLVSALTAVPQYGSTNNGSSLRLSSTFLGSEPDITITVAGGDGSTLSLTRDIVAEGVAGTADLTDAVWSYYVINQEVRTDDDTVMMMPTTNQITSRRGIIEDADVLMGLAADNSVIATAQGGHQIVTGNRATQFVVSGSWGSLLTLTNTTSGAGDSVLVRVVAQTSTNGGTSWDTIASSLSFVLRSSGISTNQDGRSLWITLPIIGVIPAEPNTTYDVRCMIEFEDGNRNRLPVPPTNSGYVDFIWNALFIEELATTFTDTGEDVATVISNSQFTVTAPTSLAMGQRIADNGQGNNHVTISNVAVSGNTATVTHGIRAQQSPFGPGESIFRQ